VLLIHADDRERQVFWGVRIDGSDSHVLYEQRYDPTQIVKTPSWSSNGRWVYFLRSSMRGRMVLDLLRVPIDPSSFRVDGESEVVLSGLQTQIGPGMGGEYTFSRDGSLLLYTRETRHSNLWMANVEADKDNLRIRPHPMTSSTTHKSRARISPDGRRAVFAVIEGDAQNIFVLDLKPTSQPDGWRSASLRQLTHNKALNDCPAWSPDGRAIVYLSTEGGAGRIWYLTLDGSAARMLKAADAGPWGDVLEWSPGPAIIYRSAGFNVLDIYDPSREEHSVLKVDRGGYLFEPIWSPDGSRIALFQNLESRDGSEMGLWLFSADGRSHQKLVEGLVYPVGWSADGRWIYVWWRPDRTQPTRTCIGRVSANGGTPEPFLDMPPESPRERYDGIQITPDGRTVLFMKRETQSDAWLVENFDSRDP
jgi:Tol biopolymer transport system component